jgi:hypothetical protein
VHVAVDAEFTLRRRRHARCKTPRRSNHAGDEFMIASNRCFAVLITAIVAGCSSATPTDTSKGDTAPTLAEAQATRKSHDLEAWRKDMARTAHPYDGCFKATHPSTIWVEVPCVKAPAIPYLPKVVGEDVGNLSGDVSPAVSGTSITWADGTFPQANVGSSNSAYSLQINSNPMPNTPLGSLALCAGASDPSSCRGWEQFVYASEYIGDPDVVFIQYWLLNYNNPCPSGWTGSQNNCFTNSDNAAAVPDQPLSNLGNLKLTATAGSSDQVTLSANGTLYSVSQASKFGLNSRWTTAEFNVFGNGEGSQVSFNPGSTVVVRTETSTASGTRREPANSGQSFTGETNNLTVVAGSVCLFGGDHPGIQFMESNAAGATPPTCPSLLASPISFPAGTDYTYYVDISGNLVGQSSNTALRPSTCTVSGPLPASLNMPYGPAPNIRYSMPWNTPAGTKFVETISCDNGQSAQQTITAQTAAISASPATVKVLVNGCATAQYSGTTINWADSSEATCAPVPPAAPWGITSTLPSGIQASSASQGAGEYFKFCDSSGKLQNFDVQVTAVGCNETAVTDVHVEVVSCVPKTSCGNSCQSAMPDGCGGTIDCAGSCTGGTTCTAPQGTTAGLLCCEPGQYIPAGGTACKCINGGTWSSTLKTCVQAGCPIGEAPCTCGNGAHTCTKTSQACFTFCNSQPF